MLQSTDEHIMWHKPTLKSGLMEYVPFAPKVPLFLPMMLLLGYISLFNPVKLFYMRSPNCLKLESKFRHIMHCVRLFRQQSERHKEIPPVITSQNKMLHMIKWLKYWIRSSYYTPWLCHKIRDTTQLWNSFQNKMLSCLSINNQLYGLAVQ